MSRHFLGALLGCTVLALAALPASADTPTLLGVSRDWSAFTSGTGGSKICYVLSKPTSSKPKAKRDPIYFLINDWPGRRAKGEPEAVPGYQYKDGSTVTASVGGVSVTFFTQNNAGQGAAWVRERADELKLITAMRTGSVLVVTGTSKRGTKTMDTFSLTGFGDALDKAHAACGM